MRGAKYGDYLIKFLLIVGCMAILAMMIVVSFNIFGRWMSRPIVGALEIAGLCGAVAAAVAIPYCAKEKRNVAVDVAATRLPQRLRGWIDTFTFTLSLIGVGLVMWVTFKEAFHAASFGDETLVAAVPTAPFKFIWAIGLLLLCLVLIRDIVGAIRRGMKQ